MTAKVCRWIAVSRFGMLATEILDLLSGREPAFPRLSWSRFYRALAPHLLPIDERTGQDLLAFSDDQLRLAVYQRYLDMHSPSDRATDALRAVHGELAHYFRNAAIEEDGEFPKWRDRKRDLGELPHHQLGGGMWDALEKTLTDIGFVEAKSRAGMAADLVRDYAAAERAWPGQEAPRRSDREHQRRVQEYVDALVTYSSAHSAGRDGQAVEVPPLPEPPPSVLRTTEPVVTDARREWTPLERVRAWGHFVSNHTMALASGTESAFQLAYNSADSGPVPDALEDRLRHGAGPPAPWFSLKSRPAFLLHPACLKTFEGHTDWVRALAVTTDGRRAVSASNDKTLRVWDLETGDSRVLESHTKGVAAVAMTPDGRRAVSGGDDHTLRVWDLETGRFRRFEEHTQGIWAVAMTPDGRRAVSGSEDSTLRVWDLETGHSRVLQGHAYGVWAVAVTPDGKRAISGSPDNNLCVWDLEAGQCLRTLAGPPGNEFRGVCMTPDGRRAVTGGRKILCVWDLETGHSRVLEGHTSCVNAVAVMPDGKGAVSGSLDHTLRVWDLETGCSRVLEGHTDAVFAIAATPDGRRAVSGGRDSTLRVWDLELGQPASARDTGFESPRSP
jgi:WD40 repeat protein